MRLALTRRADYAVRAMIDLAARPNDVQSGTQLAHATGIPIPFVGQVMGDLVHAGLVEPRVGRTGGYRLARPAHRISMLSIVEAVEGDTRRRKCVLRNVPCGEDHTCAVHGVFLGAQEALIERLAAASLADVQSEAHPAQAAMAPEATVRRVRPGDRLALVDFYATLSPESSYARFLGFTHGVGEERARSFCALDHMSDEGFVAVADEGGPGQRRERIVGHLCLEPAGARRLELAVAVADAYQGRGVGRRLVETALTWAQEHRFQAVLATAFADNFRVLRLLSSAPYPVHVLPADGGTVDVVMPLVADLLPDKPAVIPPELRASRRRRRRRRQQVTLNRCSRVVWRGRRPPVRAAGGSVSKESS
jgi:Rrf2 family protein